MVRFTAYEHMVHVGVLIYHSYQSPVELRRRRRRRRRLQASPAFGKEEGRRVAYEVMKEIASSVALAAASLDPPASSSSLRFSSLLPLGSGSSREGDARLGLRKGMETSLRRGSHDSPSSSNALSFFLL
ncbi:hypothetical protein B296_00031787 [Ensete ventricosum]|uniref:Uncharacterized protein n=1 Tax=Ensete ventricosum TaxID=4639 RepID=A0A427AFE2_ENSVE|nr:hypothetical protein B296_00031787 [Ensete ventricosum]